MLLATAMVAGSAFAAVQNVRVSGSVDSTYLFRKNFDLGHNTGVDEKQSTFLTQAILQVDADLTDQVGATIALINERPWVHEDSSNSSVDILLAYVTLREMLYSPLTLIIGRQSFRYGNSLIVDSSGTNNHAPDTSGLADVADDLTKQTTLDAIRAILDYNPLTIDIVYAQIDETSSGSIYTHDDDTMLAGINANYQLGDDYNSIIEAYFWKKVDQNPAGGIKADEVYTVGGRVSTNPFEGLNLQVENAYQKGTHNFGTNHARRNAWAVQFIANYQIPAFDEYNPTAQYVYTKVTGNAEDSDDDGDFTGWDPMFENQAGGKIYNALFDLTNAEIHTITLGFNPMEDLLAKLSVTGLFLERDLGAGISQISLNQPGSSSDVDVEIKRENSDLGKEIDFELIYDYTEDVQIGGNLGWFIPKGVFTSTSGQTAKQAIVHVNVNF